MPKNDIIITDPPNKHEQINDKTKNYTFQLNVRHKQNVRCDIDDRPSS